MAADSVARVYADVNQLMPRSYWDYDSVVIGWGHLENYEVVRKIGGHSGAFGPALVADERRPRQVLGGL